MAMLFFTQAQLPSGADPTTAAPASVNVFGLAVGIAIYALPLASVGTRLHFLASALWDNKIIVCIVTLAIISTLWSHVPLLTLRRSFWLAGTTIVGMLYGRCQSEEQQSDVLCALYSDIRLG